MHNFKIIYFIFFLDLFGKAKKKILKQDEISDFTSPILSSNNQRNKEEIDWGPQEIGDIFYIL